MRRWSFVLTFGLALGFLVTWVDLPFQAAFYNLLMRLRGPQPANPEIIIVTFPVVEQPAPPENRWLPQLKEFLFKLRTKKPKTLVLDFALEDSERETIQPEELPYPVIWHRELSRRSAEIPMLQLVSSPENEGGLSESMYVQSSPIGAFDPHLASVVAPEKVAKLPQDRPRLINVVGPPGSFQKVGIETALQNSLVLQQLSGSVILVASPPTKPHAHLGNAPFYPSRGAIGESAAELDANAIDSVLRERSIRIPPRYVILLVTVFVSILTTLVLFSTVPLLGILAVVFVLAGLLLSGLIALHHFVYLDISKPVLAIAIAYYFLVPYRLILEYKGRWRYQEEARLLSEVETLKDNFMSLVSHNLKTPIARIQGIVEALLSSKDNDPKLLRGELEKIFRSSEDLHKFVSRILTLTRVERPEFQLRLANKDVNAMIERLIEAHRSLAIEKNISVSTKLEPLFPLLMDGDLVQESVANLIENAIKYTPPGGKVEVTTSEATSWVRIEVADTGAGIRPEDWERIFQKFYRSPATSTQGVRGSGLGLYLVKYFIELHGGSVAVAAREGGGSVFTIQLPRK